MPRKVYTIAINPPNPDNWGRVCITVFLHGTHGGTIEFTPGFSREQITQVAITLLRNMQAEGATANIVDYWSDAIQGHPGIGPDDPRHLQAVAWARGHKTEPHERNE